MIINRIISTVSIPWKREVLRENLGQRHLMAAPEGSPPVLVTRAADRTTKGTCQEAFVGMSLCSREAATRIITPKHLASFL